MSVHSRAANEPSRPLHDCENFAYGSFAALVQSPFCAGFKEPHLRPHEVLHGVSEGLGVHEEQPRGGDEGHEQRHGLRLPHGEQLHPVPDREDVRPHPGEHDIAGRGKYCLLR